MKKHMMTTVAATAAVAAIALGSAAPAMATKSGMISTPGSDDMSWVMPDLDGVVLKHAILTVEDVTAPVVVNIGTVTMCPPTTGMDVIVSVEAAWNIGVWSRNDSPRWYGSPIRQ